MTSGPRRQVQVTPGTAIRAALTALGAMGLLVVLDQSRQVIEWLLVAVAAAVLLNGPVRVLSRQFRRGIAVAVVTLVALVALGALTYGVADAALGQYQTLRERAPAAAQDLERSSRFREVARRVRLAERTRVAVDAVPEALAGSPVAAAQTAAQRFGEFLLVATLAVFILASYDRFTRRIRLLAARARLRWPPAAALVPGAVRGVRGARHAVGRAGALGLATGIVTELAGLPAPVVLGLWMACWRLLPLLGFALGYTPVVLLLLVTGHPAWVAALALVVLAGVELLALRADRRPWTQADGTPPAAFASAAALIGGFEYAGVAGALVALVAAHVLIGIMRSLAAFRVPISASADAAALGSRRW